MTVSAPNRPSATAKRRSGQTPPQFAEERGVGVKKVLDWIAAGELVAINIATRPDKRPRWWIPQESIERFEAARSSTLATQRPGIRSRKRAVGVKEFF